MIKHTALLASLQAGLSVILGEWLHSEFLDSHKMARGWMETFSSFVLAHSPTTTLFIFVLTVSIFGIFVFFRRQKRKSHSAASIPPTLRARKRRTSRPALPRRPLPHTTSANHVDIATEWNHLDEAEKEAIRAIVSQGGLWERDIHALLQARGFLHPTATIDSLAERVSFMDCDYASYYSIRPEHQAQVVDILTRDHTEGYL